jgi:hypothetical protein
MDGHDQTVLEHFLDLTKNISLFSELNKIVICKNRTIRPTALCNKDGEMATRHLADLQINSSFSN